MDSGDTCLDHDVIERSRGITVFADEAAFTACGLPFRLIDTPGHADFSGEMERSIWAVDCAVLVVSCVEGVQAHTETRLAAAAAKRRARGVFSEQGGPAHR